MTGKKGSVQINFNLMDDLKVLLGQFDKAVAEAMDETYQKSQAKVRVRTGALKESGKRGVKKKTGEILGWCSYGKKGIRHTMVEESRHPYLKQGFDVAQKKVDDKIKVEPPK